MLAAIKSIPPSLLRFVEHEDRVWFMDSPIYENLVVQNFNIELPIVRMYGVHLGVEGVRVGYCFDIPKPISKVHPNYLLVSKAVKSKWEPHIGLPGLQFYTSDSGLLAISTRITSYLNSLRN